MKTSIAAFVAILGISCLALVPFEKDSLPIGAKAPKSDLKLKSTTGKSLTLKEFHRNNGLIVMFSCNTCPFVVGRKEKGVEGWQGRYNGIYKHAESNDVGMVMVNSNAAKRDNGDSYDDMIAHYKKSKLKGSYVLDEGSVLADAFGAKTTPHIFLFDSEMRLVYKGAIDDNHRSAKEVKEHFLKNAIDAMVAKTPITVNKTKAMGCSIKRVQAK